MKKILLVTDVNFWERSSGHRMRISALIEYLAKYVKLTVVNTGPAPENIETILAKKIEAEFFVLEKTKYLNSNGYGRKLKAFLKDRHFDATIIEYIHSSYFLNFLVDDTKLILDAHDIISKRADEFKKFDYPGALYEMPADTEAEIFSVYDHVMVLCQADYDEVTAMGGKALLCPHPHELYKHEPRKAVKNIAFVASAYLPNRDGINWFIKNCWPKISAANNVQLSVYGTVCEGLNVNDERIFLKGFIPQLDKVYAEADIVINPVRFGAGLKIKNVEALANGLPLVTTTHGARGLESGINNAFLVADTADEFVWAISTLMADAGRCLKLSQNAVEFAALNFSPEKCFEPLMRIIHS